MKGVVLAGGLGTRLRPLTKVTNKHLLPVYDRPMIYYPLETLCRAGISEVMLVTGGNSAGDFLRLLGNGAELGFGNISYAYQEGERGIADALRLCEHFAAGERIVVVLGDNIVHDDIAPYVRRFEAQASGARILLKEVDDAARFGVPVFDAERIVAIEEKPAQPKSRYAVTGVYMFDGRVFDFIRTLNRRGAGSSRSRTCTIATSPRATCATTCSQGAWSDAGTFESLFRAGELVRSNRSGFSYSVAGILPLCVGQDR